MGFVVVVVEGRGERGRGDSGEESVWFRRAAMISEGVGKLVWVAMEEKSSERRLLFVSKHEITKLVVMIL